jgi:hypothetical protein
MQVRGQDIEWRFFMTWNVAMQETKSEWSCPWCQVEAILPGNPSVICESRRCQCGALGVAAPLWDTDEIIDDAIGSFGGSENYLTPFDSDR